MSAEEHLKMFKCLVDTGADVLRNLSEIRLLDNQGISFSQFLENERHYFYHQYEQNTLCCPCISHDCTIPSKGRMLSPIFKKVYQFDAQRGRQDHFVRNGTHSTQKCIQAFIPKNISLDQLDLSELNYFLWNKGRLSYQETSSMKVMMDTRNRLCHPLSTSYIDLHEISNMWAKLEKAILALSQPERYKSMVKMCIESQRASQRMETEKILYAVNQMQETVQDETKTRKDCAGDSKKLIELLGTAIGLIQNNCVFAQASPQVATACQTSGSNGQINMTATLELPSLSMEEQRQVVEKLPTELQVGSEDESIKIDGKQVKSIVLDLRVSSSIFRNTDSLRSALMALVREVVDKGKIDTTVKNTIHVTLTFNSILSKCETTVLTDLLTKKMLDIIDVESGCRIHDGSLDAEHADLKRINSAENISQTKVGEQANVENFEEETDAEPLVFDFDLRRSFLTEDISIEKVGDNENEKIVEEKETVTSKMLRVSTIPLDAPENVIIFLLKRSGGDNVQKIYYDKENHTAIATFVEEDVVKRVLKQAPLAFQGKLLKDGALVSVLSDEPILDDGIFIAIHTNDDDQEEKRFTKASYYFTSGRGTSTYEIILDKEDGNTSDVQLKNERVNKEGCKMMSFIQSIKDDGVSVTELDFDSKSHQKEIFLRLLLITTDVFTDILRHIIKSSIPNFSYENLKHKLPQYEKIFTKKQRDDLQKIKLATDFDSLGFDLLFLLIKHITSIKSKSELEIFLTAGGEIRNDVERMQTIRKNLFDTCSRSIGNRVFRDYILQCHDICHRNDMHFLQTTNFEERMTECLTRCLDIEMMKRVQFLRDKIRYLEWKIPIPLVIFNWGDSFDSNIKNIRSLLRDIAEKGIKKVSLKIHLQDKNDLPKRADICNALYDEIIRRSTDINFF